MKTPLRVRSLTTFATLISGLLLSNGPLRAQNYWTGGAGTPLWSNPGNWSYWSTPSVYDIVGFDTYGQVWVQGQVNNIVDTSFTISGLAYSTVTTNGYCTTQINPGLTLALSPQPFTANAIMVGEWAGATGGGIPVTNWPNDQVYATIVGTNAVLNVNGLNSSIRIEQAAASGSHWATLDLSGVSTFTAVVSNILIGADLGNAAYPRPNGTLILARTNNLTTRAMGTAVPGILLGCGGWTNTDGGLGNLTLGQVNVFNVDWLAVAGHRANQGTCTLGFGPNITGGTFKLRGSGGGRAPLVTIGDNQASDTYSTAPYGLWGTSRGNTGVAELRGATVDIQMDSLIVGRNLTTNEAGAFNTGATGVGNGTLNFDAGLVDVNNLFLGYKIGTNYGGATGSLTVGGGTLNVNNNIVMSSRTYVNGGWNGGNGSATLTIASNATANVSGDILKGTSGQGSATLNLNYGGQLNLQPGERPLPGSIGVDTLNLNADTLMVASNVTAGSTLNLNASSLNNFNVISAGTLNLNAGTISNGLSVTANTLTGTNGLITSVPNVTNSTSLLPGTTALAGSLSVAGNLTLKTNATLTFPVADTTAVTPNGVNSYLYVSGNLTPLSSNVLSIAPLAPLAPGTCRLADYAGSLGGLPLTFTNTTRYSLSLDTTVPNQINLVNAGGTYSNLVWKGSTATGGTNWNLLAATNLEQQQPAILPIRCGDF